MADNPYVGAEYEQRRPELKPVLGERLRWLRQYATQKCGVLTCTPSRC